MSIKYELSLWRDFPGARSMQEEKDCVLAATGMQDNYRAANIELKRSYNGDHSLTFEIPVLYQDEQTGETKYNPLVQKIQNESKIKLWRDEYWWNPFAEFSHVDEKTGCSIYKGAFVQGRWYDFCVKNISEKRNKKKLSHVYTCKSLFMSELSHTGYDLEFVSDTDIMSVNGMGTAHELAARVVDGTSWNYIKTEVFPDYKQEFNPSTGETIKTPVSTDQIEFVKGLDRYGYCYEYKVDNADKLTKLRNHLTQEATKYNVDLIEGVNWGVENSLFWWKKSPQDLKKNFVYGYEKSNINPNLANVLLAQDCGLIKQTPLNKQDAKPEKIGISNFNKDSSWIPNTYKFEGETDSAYNSRQNSVVSIQKRTYEPDATHTGDEIAYFLKFDGNRKSSIISAKTLDPIDAGKYFAVRLITRGAYDIIICDYTNHELIEKVRIEVEPQAEDYITNIYPQTYWFMTNTRIEQPKIVIEKREDDTETIKGEIFGIFIYDFVGADSFIEEKLKKACRESDAISGLVKNLEIDTTDSDAENTNITVNPTDNYYVKDNFQKRMWTPFGNFTSVENLYTDVYLIELNKNGEYIDIYLPRDGEYKKLSSYEADKRRALSASKSNRYSILEQISKTFYCFTKFLVEHDADGHISTDSAGAPKKYFTFTSELGRRQFNGFNYGVNLDTIERKRDSSNLVTKMYVENIDNEYNKNGTVSIQNSIYNKMRTNFIYNFSYYINRGLVDRTIFMDDYKKMSDQVSNLNIENLSIMDEYTTLQNQVAELERDITINKIFLKNAVSEAQEDLDAIRWTKLIDKEKELTGENPSSYMTFPNITMSKFYLFNSSAGMPYEDITLNWESIKDPIIENGYGYKTIKGLSNYMAYHAVAGATGVLDTDDFISGGLSPLEIESKINRILILQQRYSDAATAKANAEKALNGDDNTSGAKDKVEEYLNIFNNNNTKVTKLIKDFEQKYIQFIIEGTWSASEYIDADTYYLDATKTMSTSCVPKVEYTIGAVDLSRVINPCDPMDNSFAKDFTYEVGDTTYVKDEELFGNVEQLAMIAEITSYVDKNKQDNISMKNFDTRFEELFQSIAAAVTTLQLNENIYSRAAAFTADGGINEAILQKAFTDNKNLVIASANNDVVQDNRGLTITEKNSTNMVRLIGGGIFLSPDGGNTYPLGITPQGVNASIITTGQLDTSKIVIRSSDAPQLTLDSLGLTAYDLRTSSNLLNRFVRHDQFGLYMTEKGELFGTDWWKRETDAVSLIQNNSIFSLTKNGLVLKGNEDNKIYLSTQENLISVKVGNTNRVIMGKLGNNNYGFRINNENGEPLLYTKQENNTIALYVKGEINATSGQIGGWNITSDALQYRDSSDTLKMFLSGTGSQSTDYTVGSHTGKDFLIWANSKFGVTNTGELYAQDATISGKIVATDGEIAGWAIDSTRITTEVSGKGSFYLASAAATSYDNWLVAKDSSGTITFKLSKEGAIAAIKGEIAGWYISQHGLYKITQTATSNSTGQGIGLWPGTLHSHNGSYIAIHAGADVQHVGSAPFRVYHNGVVYCTDLILAGRNNNNVISSIPMNLIYDEGGTGFQYLTSDGDENRLSFRGTSGIFLSWQANKYNNSSINLGLSGDNNQYSIVLNSGYNATYSAKKGYLKGVWEVQIGGSPMAVSSDYNLKNTINPISLNYDMFFDSIKPVTYKYNDGSSDRLHIGFISQQIQEALELNDLTDKDFAGVVITNYNSKNEEGPKIWALRYEEFISLNTWQIQKLKARVAELEAKIAKLIY